MVELQEKIMNKGPILIIDGMNVFIRHYIRHPGMSTHGYHVGGMLGTLNSLASLIDLLRPSVVYFVWESGGNSRRRMLLPDYKRGRKPPKLNRYYEDDIPDSMENRVYQIKHLISMLELLGVCQLFIEDCEADDVIGYICRNTFKDMKKVVASSDRDFYQLIDDKTMQYSWSSRKFIDSNAVRKEMGVIPANFVTARTFTGDSSDNIPGVKGVGFKTLLKSVPQLAGDEELSIKDIIKHCESNRGSGLKTYEKLYEHSADAKRNWRIMYLDVSNLAAQQIRKIESIIDDFKPSLDKMKLMRLMIDEGLPTFNVHDLFSIFLTLRRD